MTALGQGWIYVMDMKVLDYKLKKVDVPGYIFSGFFANDPACQASGFRERQSLIPDF